MSVGSPPKKKVAGFFYKPPVARCEDDSSKMGHQRPPRIWSCRSPPSSLPGKANNKQSPIPTEIGGKQSILYQMAWALSHPQSYPMKSPRIFSEISIANW